MDSLSQIVLGAATLALVAKRAPVRRAMIYGAVLGTLPDLDSLLLVGKDAVERFTEHRGFSHSLIVLALLSPMLAMLIRRLDPLVRAESSSRWTLAVALTLLTHPLLDAFTIYGTQLLWPLQVPPVTWGSVFIIDPLYTLPLACGCVLAWRHRSSARLGTLGLGLLLSTCYLGWSAAAKIVMTARAELALQAVEHERYVMIPAPFTTFGWRLLVITPDGFAEGWFWLWDTIEPSGLRHYAFDVELDALAYSSVERLRWFTHGFAGATAEDDVAVVTDLRMGSARSIAGYEGFVFQFEVAERTEDGWSGIRPRTHSPRKPWPESPAPPLQRVFPAREHDATP